MDEPTSEQRFCSVCGTPIRWDNKYGICKKTPACNKARWVAMRDRYAAGNFSAEGPCLVEGCDLPRHARGLCGPHSRRMKKYGDPGPATRRSWNRTAIAVGDRFGRWLSLAAAADSRQVVPCRCE